MGSVGSPAATAVPTTSPASVYGNQPSRSPWIAQLAQDQPPRPLRGDASADVVVVGAGIAGVATAFFLLRLTTKSVLLIERDRVARGATGRNAGQLTTYFERPLSEISEQFGPHKAAQAQAGIEGAHDLLDLMVAESGATVRVERFTGHMGMFNLHHVQTHLRSSLVRRHGGLRPHGCVISEDAEFLPRILGEFAGLYTVVPQARVRELLQIRDDRYCAVLSNQAGCANSGALSQQMLAHMQRRHPDRFRFVDHSGVDRIVVDDDKAVVQAHGHRVSAANAVLCTNGFVDHMVEDPRGSPIRLAADQQIVGRVAYMTAFVEDKPRAAAAMSYIRNDVIGGDTAYVYVTRRTYDRPADIVTLTCMGGPEYATYEPVYDPDAPFPGDLLTTMDEQVRPFAQPGRPPRRRYDFHWHGLMGYNESGIRVIGAHRHHPRLLYNLGCNGVGFLPSIYGGHRVASLLAGQELATSIFDPR